MIETRFPGGGPIPVILGPGEKFIPNRPRMRSSKTYGHDIGLSCAFRQWRADSHCRFLHGYALAVRLTFEARDLDRNGWVLDFGALKPFKAELVDLLDHKTLVALDDPEFARFEALHEAGVIDMMPVAATGCEALALRIFERCSSWLLDSGHGPRVRLVSVEVREHGANGAEVIA
jgi:6-pyruvoyltetrahydropterin/6-carboxytetrahydropterin synthase